jgi:hypothetical protein
LRALLVVAFEVEDLLCLIRLPHLDDSIAKALATLLIALGIRIDKRLRAAHSRVKETHTLHDGLVVAVKRAIHRAHILHLTVKLAILLAHILHVILVSSIVFLLHLRILLHRAFQRRNMRIAPIHAAVALSIGLTSAAVMAPGSELERLFLVIDGGVLVLLFLLLLVTAVADVVAPPAVVKAGRALVLVTTNADAVRKAHLTLLAAVVERCECSAALSANIILGGSRDVEGRHARTRYQRLLGMLRHSDDLHVVAVVTGRVDIDSVSTEVVAAIELRRQAPIGGGRGGVIKRLHGAVGVSNGVVVNVDNFAGHGKTREGKKLRNFA